MKPLNLDNKPCSPISSNCVIWQGPDIPCINLCAGDTVSDVVFKLATELCTIIDQLDVSNYDLSCFDLASCTPQTFQELLQFLIEQICAAQGITVSDGKVIGCPDCLVSVAPCFQTGGQTTMQLVDYVQMIAERVCSIIDQINQLINQVNNLEIRVEILENTPPPVFTLPSIEVDCTLADGIIVGGNSYPIDQILDALINDPVYGYCALTGATGLPADILSAVASQCITGTDPTLTDPDLTYSAAYAPNWVNSPLTAADAITNIWLVLCDMYNYLQTIQIDVVDTNTVNLTYTAGVLQADVQDTGWVNLLGFSYMASATTQRPQCRRIGNEIIFRGVIQVPIGNAGSGASGTAISVNQPDAYRAEPYGLTLNSVLSGDPDACAINGAGASGTIPSGSTNIDEGIIIYFNRGVRAIPTSVLPAGINFDRDSTNGNRQLIYRNINVSGDNVFLSSVSSAFVNSTGIIGITAPNNNENFNGDGIIYSSMQRNIVSNISSGDNIPLFTPAAPSANNTVGVAGSTYNADITVSASTWPFSQNCMSAFQLGGFSVRIDGLRAYIDPCATTIPTPTPCP